MSGSSYRSRLPYNFSLGHAAPLLAAGLVPTGLDDDFTAEGAAQYTIDGAPQAGMLTLDPKWLTYDPDESLDYCAIDARLQMAYLLSSNEKSWCGVYQPLPLPSTQKRVREHWVTARVLLGTVGNGTGATFINPAHWGLLLSEDLATDPFNAVLRHVGGFVVHGNNGEFGAVTQSGAMSATFLGNNAPVIPEGLAGEGGGASPTFFRARIRQELALDNTYTARVIAEVGTTGVDWLPVSEWNNDSLSAPAVKHVGFGARASSGVSIGAYCDMFRCVECPITEYLTLGTVPRIAL